MERRHDGGIALVAASALALSSCRAALDAAPEEAVARPPLPAASRLRGVCWVEMASSFGFTGSSLLLRHPDDMLVDASRG